MPYRVVNTCRIYYRSTRTVTVYIGTITLRSKNQTKGNKTESICKTLSLRRVCATILVAEKSKYYVFWACACSLRCPACNAYAPYSHLCPARLYNIFPHYLINGTILEKKGQWIQNTQFGLSTTSVWKLKNKRPTWCHLLFYFTSYVFNMFRTLIYI